MHDSGTAVATIPDAFELFFKLRQLEVAIIQYVTGFTGYAQSLWFTCSTLFHCHLTGPLEVPSLPPPRYCTIVLAKLPMPDIWLAANWQ